MEIIRKGKVNFLEYGENVIAYKRTLADEELLVMCNFTEEEVEIPQAEISEDTKCSVLLDSYSEKQEFSQKDTVVLRPYEGIAILGKRK